MSNRCHIYHRTHRDRLTLRRHLKTHTRFWSNPSNLPLQPSTKPDEYNDSLPKQPGRQVSTVREEASHFNDSPADLEGEDFELEYLASNPRHSTLSQHTSTNIASTETPAEEAFAFFASYGDASDELYPKLTNSIHHSSSLTSQQDNYQHSVRRTRCPS